MPYHQIYLKSLILTDDIYVALSLYSPPTTDHFQLDKVIAFWGVSLKSKDEIKPKKKKKKKKQKKYPIPFYQNFKIRRYFIAHVDFWRCTKEPKMPLSHKFLHFFIIYRQKIFLKIIWIHTISIFLALSIKKNNVLSFIKLLNKSQ